LHSWAIHLDYGRVKVKDAIEEKLRRQLSSRAHLTECRVVYILAEIRKLIERERQQKKYYALTFHCSWALHTTMDRGEGAARILKRFDKAYVLLKEKNLHDLPTDLSNDLIETIDLKKFRAELDMFLTAHDLPRHVVGHDWTKFLRLYAAVIEDCALIIKDETIDLKNITHVTVHKDDAQKKIRGAGKTFTVFRIRWISLGKNNKTGTLDNYYTVP
jgi:hypothetical protein